MHRRQKQLDEERDRKRELAGRANELNKGFRDRTVRPQTDLVELNFKM